jgi:hypothetical protein
MGIPNEKQSLINNLKVCGGGGNCKNQVWARYQEISQPMEENFSIKDHYDIRLKLTEEV